MALSGGHRTVNCPLKLRTVGEPGQVIRPGLTRVLARAVERDGDLVRDSGHELQVARLKGPGQTGRDGHRAEQHALGAQLRADRAPLTGDPVHTRLRRSG